MNSEYVFGELLKQFRVRADVTQQALANGLGYHRNTISSWERFERLPTNSDIVKKIGAFLALNQTDLAALLASADFLPSAYSESADFNLPPVGHLPPPGNLPPQSRISFLRNHLFTGRETALMTLAEALLYQPTQRPLAITPVLAATGLGGIGKTQLATEFAYRYGRFFTGGVFWLSFAEADSISNEIAQCGGLDGMDLPDFDTFPLEKQVKLVQREWRQPIDRLLIFDNCEDETLLGKWLPTSGGCRILITSRQSRWDPTLGVDNLALDVLTRAESLSLLLKFVPAMSDSNAHALADKLGDFPLALHLAGNYLARHPHAMSIPQYLAQLAVGDPMEHPSLRGVGTHYLPTQHEKNVARTFALSYEQLDPHDLVDACAQILLSRAACFAPGEPIPQALLFATVKYDASKDSSPPLAESLTRLVKMGLIEQEGDEVHLHRLVALFVNGLDNDPQQETAVAMTLYKEAYAINREGFPHWLRPWQAHLRHVTEKAIPMHNETAALLCNEIGFYLDVSGDYLGAKRYYECALTIREQVWGPHHGATAGSSNNLGLLYVTMGDYAQGRAYYEQALSIRLRLYGLWHRDTAQSYNNLGHLLLLWGHYDEALPHLEQALAIREKIYGLAHRDTVTTLKYLGKLYHAQNKLEKAYTYFAQALEIDRKILEPNHPDISSILNHLGLLLTKLKNYDEAHDHLQTALKMRLSTLGKEHPDIATTLNSFGELHFAQGEYREAESFFKQALAIRQQIFANDHPDIAQSYFNMGLIWEVWKKHQQALGYLQRAHEIYTLRLGVDHPSTKKAWERVKLYSVHAASS